MSRYRKLIAAVIGLVVIVGNDFFGLGLNGEEIGRQVDLLIDAGLALVTAAGVYQFRNDPA